MRRIFPFALLAALIAQASEVGSTAGSLRSALQSKALAWSLSEPGEVEAILGAPRARSSQRDGGMELEVWSYGPEVDVIFRRERGSQAPFVLAGLREGERVTRRLPGERFVLRSASDLGQLPRDGVQGGGRAHPERERPAADRERERAAGGRSWLEYGDVYVLMRIL